MTKKLIILTCFLLLSIGVFGSTAQIVDTTGEVKEISPPASVAHSAYESDTVIRAFQEIQLIRLIDDIAVDASASGTYNSPEDLIPTTISAGTVVTSHFLHLDPTGTTTVILEGSLTFDADILGVLVLNDSLDNTDGVLGAGSTQYPVGNSRGLELDPNYDWITIESDRRKIIVHLLANDQIDQVRVITSVNGSTLHVPGAYATIQAGIDAASNGDTVLVANGTYKGTGNKNLDFRGKAITVKSENGASSCIIDSEGVGQGFYFHSGEEAGSVLSGFTITNGNAVYGGGIACWYSSSPTIEDCIVTGNMATNAGGGIACIQSSFPIITRCIISGNTAGSWGGGILCLESSSPTITNCVIFENEVLGIGNGGGGICCYPSCSPIITNCTITGNTVSDKGGGVFSHDLSSPTITNSIIWNNTPNEIYGTSGASLGITYSDVQGGFTGEGNIDSVPLFTGSGDYHLTAPSPCINAGDNAAPDLPSTDKDGNPRIIGGIVDMGAYEYQPIIYVDKDDDTCGGKNPCYTSIQEAIDVSSNWSVIKVAQGNYEEDITLNESKTLALKGGYDSTFTTQSSNTIIKGSLVVSNGKFKISKIKVHFQK